MHEDLSLTHSSWLLPHTHAHQLCSSTSLHHVHKSREIQKLHSLHKRDGKTMREHNAIIILYHIEVLFFASSFIGHYSAYVVEVVVVAVVVALVVAVVVVVYNLQIDCRCVCYVYS